MSLDWDALAPYWHHFEGAGFETRALSWIEGVVVAPCLYLGAGRGTYAARLADTIAPGVVIAIDRSLPMLHAGTTRIPMVCADATALPLVSEAFQTVVIATGVLEGMDVAARRAGLSESRRVLAPDGAIIAALLVSGPDRSTWATLDEWLADPRPHPLYDRLAADLGGRDAAHRLLRASVPEHEAIMTAADLSEAAAPAGLTVTARLDVSPSVALFRLVAAGLGSRR